MACDARKDVARIHKRPNLYIAQHILPLHSQWFNKRVGLCSCQLISQYAVPTGSFLCAWPSTNFSYFADRAPMSAR